MQQARATLKTFGTFAIGNPLRAAFTHGNQALVTLASAYMNAQFAQSHNILEPWIAWALAVGYEWTYLRGLASADRTKSDWSTALNVVAFATAIIGGLLYCADRYSALPAAPTGTIAWLLAMAHVFPMALLSLCSAMVHRAAGLADRRRSDVADAAAQARAHKLQEQDDQLELERRRKLMEVEVWKVGRAAVHDAEVHAGASLLDARSTRQDAPNAQPALHACAICGASLNAKQYAAARRWGHCKNCKKEV